VNNFPQFPLIRPTEKDAMIDYASLQMLDAKTLLKEKEWTSRSVIDADLCLPYVISKSNVGNKSSNFYHWQSRVACDSLTAPSPIRAWYDQKLRKNIENSIYYKDSHKSALTMRGYVPSQFRPSAAKCLYSIFEAKRIYDPCGGWGDRLSAAMSVDADFYYCRDVNPLVFTGYALQQQTFLTKTNLSFEYRGSEIDCPEEDYFDFIFTSPPYYKIEKYQGDMQSHTKFKKFNDWMTEFLYPMVTFAWDSLQKNGVLALNISDCYANHEYNRICQPLIDYCLSSLSNCSIQGVIGYEITSRKKNGVNAEPILFFTKGNKKINFSEMAKLSQIQKSLDL
tara:strand:+ start:151 stop:1161 length:1011 start_codon:yes stop_codon:yes gene_type:complete